MNTMRGRAPLTSSVGPPRLLAWPGDGARRVPRRVDACDEVPSDPFTDVGWGCRSGAALYVYALSAGCTAAPAVTLTPPVALQVLPAGDCAWIVLTALPLPAAARMEVRLDGETLRSSFTTA